MQGEMKIEFTKEEFSDMVKAYLTDTNFEIVGEITKVESESFRKTDPYVVITQTISEGDPEPK